MKLCSIYLALLCTSTFLSAAQATLVNPSFEVGYTGKTYGLISEGNVPGWETDAAPGKIEIWRKGFLGKFPTDGNYLVELNVYAPDNLYQDFTVTNCAVARFKFDHTSRTSGLEDLNWSIIDRDVGNAVLFTARSVAPVNSWATRTSADISMGPSCTKNLRIEFAAINPVGGVGNLMDNVVEECVHSCLPPPPGGQGDPHFFSWNHERYDFHGVCDLVLLRNPEFNNNLGMNIHIRAKKMKIFSYIETAAISIGDDILEIAGGTGNGLYWINKVEGAAMNSTEEETVVLPETISGFLIKFTQLSEHARQFEIELSNDDAIQIKTWHKMVSVHIKGGTKENFGQGYGLMGRHEDGVKVARDGKTIIDDVNTFGQEWQVLPSEDGMNLFHNVDGPQYPQKCDIPSTADMRRRLGESKIAREDAELACSRVEPASFEICVFDVMATNDMHVAGAY